MQYQGADTVIHSPLIMCNLKNRRIARVWNFCYSGGERREKGYEDRRFEYFAI